MLGLMEFHLLWNKIQKYLVSFDSCNFKADGRLALLELGSVLIQQLIAWVI